MSSKNEDGTPNQNVESVRVQTGVRIDKQLLKVMKAVAVFHDISLGHLVESLVLHSFEGRSPFGKKSLKRIRNLKKLYGVQAEAPTFSRKPRSKSRES